MMLESYNLNLTKTPARLRKSSNSGAGWKALFTRIVASNEKIKRDIAFFFMSMVFS